MVTVEGSDWAPGETLQLGGNRLALRTADGSPASGGGPAAVHPDGAGRLLVNPAPRLLPPVPGGTVTLPGAPPDGDRSRLPWATVILPLVVSVPFAWWSGQPIYLAFALASPLIMIVQHLLDRRARRSDHARAVARHAAEAADTADELDRLLSDEYSASHLARPDPAVVGAVAAGPLQRLWERRPGDGDELVLRLGLGDVASTIEIRGSPSGGVRPPLLTDAPVTLDLSSPEVGGVAGLTGPREEVLALARSLVGQAAVLNSPRDLGIAVLTAPAASARSWNWATWLPHAVPSLSALRSGRTLLVLDGAERLRRDPPVATLLATAGPSVVILCLDDGTARLPAECGATVEVSPDGEGSTATLRIRGHRPHRFRPDLVGSCWAERLGRDLARLDDATPAWAAIGLPAQVHLFDLLAPSFGPGAHELDPARIAADWARRRQQRERATTAVVGVTANGPWLIDLGRQGPHVLLAGTTGAGKSELLTTLVVSLAVSHPPERLHLLLVDYKGGTAFGPLSDLPHTAGVLTDLDAHLARRAISSLNAELRRRERLLLAADASDVDAYERCRSAGSPALPRLVVVVDEFRVLSEELPELMTGLVRVAGVGRSLGVHLVLATQRPSGVVTAEMRANINLRIALRVRDRLDSEDVVDAGDAAGLPADTPGRGLFRVGGGQLVTFQAAQVGGRPPPRPGPSVRQLRRDTALPTAWRPEHEIPVSASSTSLGAVAAESAPGRDDLAAAVAVCRAACAFDGLPVATPFWMPPLPAVVRRADLPALLGPPAAGGRTHDGLILGIVDVPESQTREPLCWDLSTQGHLAVVGAPGTGRTEVLKAVAGAGGRLLRPVHVHAVDGGGRLTGLEGLAHVGTVVPVADVERAARLLARLLARLRAGLAEGGPGVRVPPVLLLVDGWEQVLDAWLPVDHGRLVDDLVRLARNGSAAGVRLAVTGGRSLISGPLSGLLTERFLLRAADPADLVLAGVTAAEVPSSMPPGRIVRVLPGGKGAEAQIVLDDLPRGPGRRRRGAADGAEATVTPWPPPLRLLPVPARVTAADLFDALDGDVSTLVDAGVLPLGLGGDDVSPVGPPSNVFGWIVAGVPGSGRSTTLGTAVKVLLAAGRHVVAVTDPGSPLAGAASVPNRAGDILRTAEDLPTAGAPPFAILSGHEVRQDARTLLALLDRYPASTLVVDAGGVLTDVTLEEELLTRADGGATARPSGTGWPVGPGPHVLLGTTPDEMAITFRGLVARLRAGGIAVLLAPIGPGDGSAFGARVPTLLDAPPGRALLIRSGRACAFQVAGPDP